MPARRSRRTTPTAKPRRPSSRSSAGQPQLRIIGPGEEVDAVAPALEALRARLVRIARPEDATPTAEANVLGSVLVALDAPGAAERHARRLAEDAASPPLYVLLADDPATSLVRRLYEAGAAGVFEWPRERQGLARYLAEMLSLRLTRGRAERADTALARVVRAHLKMLPEVAVMPRVDARSGSVTLVGEVGSLAARREIERCVASIPGVRRLDVGALHVLPDPVPDAKLRRSLRRLLARSPSVDERTLSVSVDAGQVVLTGTARDRHELGYVRDLATGLRGVRSIELRILVGERAKREDRGAARRLAGLVEEVFPDEDVRVAFFRGVAVLSGVASSLRVKRALEEFAADDAAVTRVVNKLDVAPAAAARPGR